MLTLLFGLAARLDNKGNPIGAAAALAPTTLDEGGEPTFHVDEGDSKSAASAAGHGDEKKLHEAQRMVVPPRIVLAHATASLSIGTDARKLDVQVRRRA